MTRTVNKPRRIAKAAMRTALGNVFTPIAATNVVALRPQPAQAPEKRKFAPDPARRVMVAKIQIAKKDLDFDDGDYRALLERITGKVSSTAMSMGELGKVLDAFKRLGWAPNTAQKPGKPKPADHPSARKARAMWISLALLGVIRQPSEAALEAFARRQLGTERLQWADQAQVYKLIEALKKIAERHGWDQTTAGLIDPIWTLKYRLCAAILRRLIAAGVQPPDATMATVLAARLGLNERVQSVAERDLEQLAAWLGSELAVAAKATSSRDAAADAHYED